MIRYTKKWDKNPLPKFQSDHQTQAQRRSQQNAALETITDHVGMNSEDATCTKPGGTFVTQQILELSPSLGIPHSPLSQEGTQWWVI